MSISSCLWRSTSPITSIQLVTLTSFSQYTTVTLYGISNQFAAQTPIAPTITSVVDQAGFASVNFLPTASDNATVYAVTDNNSNTTYGAGSPIVAPATIGSQTTYTAKAINALATTSAAGTASITSNNSYSSIATVYASSGSLSSTTFTNIPQNYTHLQLRLFAKDASASGVAGLYGNINGDSSTYWQHSLSGNGSSASSANGSDTRINSGITYIPTSANASVFSGLIIDILDYNNTSKYKTLRLLGGYDANGSGTVVLQSLLWQQFAPISSIGLGPTGGFAQYSHIALYGIA